METHEIASRDWPIFLAEFSRQHRGERCSVVTLDAYCGSHPIAEDAPLLAVAADPHCAKTTRIEVRCAGEVPAANLVYEIARPTHLLLARRADGREVALAIESDDVGRTVICLEG